ncbi:MAG: hypothetical protein IKP88_21120 [Lachnospiraceae bacterium]|nr:hypothetical protein [Lachnospiraceae bacterium]
MNYHGIRLPDKEEITTPGKKLSEGRNANVYEWGEDRVIKLFKASYPTELVTFEYYNALAVKNLPFRKVMVSELKKTEFGYGIIYEKLSGENMMDYIGRTGNLKEAAVMMADLQKSINKCTFDIENTGALISAHQLLRKNMIKSKKADSDATREMIRFLGTMKEGSSLCHGNLHPENVLITDDGPVALSASDYCIGKPLFDIAKTFFLIAYTPLPGEEKEGSECPVCRGISNTEERKEFGRHYLDAMGKSATEIGGYLSMIIAGM